MNTEGKITTLSTLASIAEETRRDGGIVVLAHGCWDLIHLGHIEHLEAARRLGNMLIVTVTADPFVHKGQGRPRFTQHQRAKAVAGLACVDYVAINYAETAADAIKIVKPHHFVKGIEFKGIEDEKAALTAIGGSMEYVSGETVCSSTQLLGGVK